MKLTLMLLLLLFILIAPVVFSEEKKTPSQLDACSLLSTESAQEILGEPTKPGKQLARRSLNRKQPPRLFLPASGESVAARNGNPKRSIYLWVRRAPAADNDSAAVMEAFRKDPRSGASREVQAIPGFGDTSFWWTGKSGD